MKKFWDNLEENLMLIFIAVMTVLTLVSWGLKYLAPDSVKGVTTLTNYSYAWVTLLCFGYSAKRHIFMRLDVITSLYSQKVQKILEFLMDIVCFLCCVALLVLGVQALVDVVASGAVEETIAVPLAVVYAAPVVGFGLAVIRYIQQAVTTLIGKKSA